MNNIISNILDAAPGGTPILLTYTIITAVAVVCIVALTVFIIIKIKKKK